MAAPPPVASLLDLRGLVAIVTGAGGLIGAGIAARLQEAGASVVVHARRDPGGVGQRMTSVTGDVERDAGAICARAVEAFGRLDAVVNNAGIQPVAQLEELGTED